MRTNRRTLALAAAAALTLGAGIAALATLDTAGPASAATAPIAQAPTGQTLVCPGNEVVSTTYDTDATEDRTPQQVMAALAPAFASVNPNVGRAMTGKNPSLAYQSGSRSDYTFTGEGGDPVVLLTFEQHADSKQPRLVASSHCNR